MDTIESLMPIETMPQLYEEFLEFLVSNKMLISVSTMPENLNFFLLESLVRKIFLIHFKSWFQFQEYQHSNIQECGNNQDINKKKTDFFISQYKKMQFSY